MLNLELDLFKLLGARSCKLSEVIDSVQDFMALSQNMCIQSQNTGMSQ